MQAAYYFTAQQLTRYVYDNAVHELTLDDMAAQMHMNRTYACEVFQRLTGVTFSDCVEQARIRRARQLLTTDAKLSTVARECGFGSEATFYRTFRRIIGMTPGKYRALHIYNDIGSEAQ